MNQAVKKIWLAALRSDEYKQTTGSLRASGGFCCLGVLCELHRKETGAGHWAGQAYLTSDDISMLSVLPPMVSDWAGFGGELCPSDKSGIKLSHSNDHGSDFKTIAAIIERDM